MPLKRCMMGCAGLFTVAAWAQQGPAVFRVTSELMMVDVQVIHNKTNTAAPGLQAKDFQLSEDGLPQQILFCGHDELPLSVVLLFDLTQSVSGVLRGLGNGAQTALDHLKPEDEVAVMVYAAGARLIDGFTTDRARTAAAIARAAAMRSWDSAFFNEAMYQGAAQLDKSTNPSSRRVILWLTDTLPNYPTYDHLKNHARGLDGAAPHTEEEAVRKLHESGTVVMPMLLKDRLMFWWYGNVPSRDEKEFSHEHPNQKDYSPGDTYTYAEVTGGFVTGLRGEGAQERLADIIDTLRARYTIGYRPSERRAPGTFCRIKVSLAPGGSLRPQEWRVSARAGYYRR